MEDAVPSLSRRGLLAGVGAGTAGALAGCADRIWSQAETNGPDQVSMTIKTVPADDDYFAATIASRIRENYQASGIDATHEPVTKAELYRDILLEGDYDVFVARSSALDDCDALYGLLHRRFVSEQGWQNPFHYADVTTNDYLETQRAADEDDRDAVLVDLIEHLLETAPYTVAAYPHQLSGVRDDIALPRPPRDAVSYLEVLSHPDNDRRDGPLEVGVFGEDLTERLNPIAVDRNRIEGLLDLLYDPLARRHDGEYVPWLAEEIEWSDEDENQLRARITLREGLEWHDGESIDADDVAFTLQFIDDTSMGAVDGGVPAQRYRDRQLLVESTERLDAETIVLFFTETTRPVASRALSIPILPEHVWSERTDVIADHQTQAVVDDNEDPVGSGLFRFADATDQEVELEPFEDHVLRESTGPTVFDEGSRFDGIRFQVAPNPGAMVDQLLEGEIDLTVSELPLEYAATIQESEDVSTVSRPAESFYMIGYNTHHPELGNPYFRRVCSRLIDRDHVVSEIFEDFARGVTTPNELVGVHDDTWSSDEFDATERTDILRFPGDDGEVDPSRVQSLFREAGYSYDDGSLLE